MGFLSFQNFILKRSSCLINEKIDFFNVLLRETLDEKEKPVEKVINEYRA